MITYALAVMMASVVMQSAPVPNPAECIIDYQSGRKGCNTLSAFAQCVAMAAKASVQPGLRVECTCAGALRVVYMLAWVLMPI